MTECSRYNHGTTCEGAGHATEEADANADVIHTIHIIDPHGEYAGCFDLDRYGSGPNAGATYEGEGAPPPMTITYNEEPDDGWDADEIRRRWPDMGDLRDHQINWGSIWELTGTLHQLRRVYDALLTDLVSPAWDWYGMGGDDHCYDYWPNSMTMAAGFRDILIELHEEELAAPAGSGELGDPDVAPASRGVYAWPPLQMTEELCRVYWLCRARYSAADSGRAADTTADQTNDEYFEDAILGHDAFGDCPDFLTHR